jgi:UDP-N-acetylmuramoylalanine--D-glutamate ligase
VSGAGPSRERPGRPPLPPGPYLVVGLARSGTAAARMLADHGEVIGCDVGAPAEADGLRAGGAAVEVHLRTDGVDLVDRVRTVVKSPGVPANAPPVAAARDRGLEVVGELELSWRMLGGEFIGVTGTNGKTTTCELLGAIHRGAGREVAVAGNVGTPLASLVRAEPRPERIVVCECSSFQLEDASEFAPECALLLNIEEDHLDRHGSLEAYREAKLRIFRHQRPGDTAVLPEVFTVGGRPPFGEAELVTFGPSGAVLSHEDGELRFRGEPLMAAADVQLRGAHNLENAMAAAAAALARGVPAAAVTDALAAFPGVRHRLEEVSTRDGVLYVNDSKATNVASALVGVDAFQGGVHAILGGSLKGGGFAGLRRAVAERCTACYLIGEAAERLAEDLDGTAPLHRCGDMERAVTAASRAASPGEVVLLSPACASYDQYRDYEERGEHFRALAARLAGPAGGPR